VGRMNFNSSWHHGKHPPGAIPDGRDYACFGGSPLDAAHYMNYMFLINV